MNRYMSNLNYIFYHCCTCCRERKRKEEKGRERKRKEEKQDKERGNNDLAIISFSHCQDHFVVLTMVLYIMAVQHQNVSCLETNIYKVHDPSIHYLQQSS
jgi:hypothetical protein